MASKTSYVAASGSGAFLPDITQNETMMLAAVREWRQAETDKGLFAELTAWDGMRHYVTEYRAGKFTIDTARECVGEEKAETFLCAVRTIAPLVHLFDDGVTPYAEEGDSTDAS